MPWLGLLSYRQHNLVLSNLNKQINKGRLCSLIAPWFHRTFFSLSFSSPSSYNQWAFFFFSSGKLSEATKETGHRDERDLSVVSSLKFHSVLNNHSWAPDTGVSIWLTPHVSCFLLRRVTSLLGASSLVFPVALIWRVSTLAVPTCRKESLEWNI